MRYCSNGLLSLANLGDTNKPDPRYPLQDASGNWQQLPYEVAHGVAKTTVQHGSDVIAAKKEYAKQKAADHEETKGKTKAAREEMEKLNSVDRFIIYNRRTGQLACADWVQKHICADQQGRPKVRNPKSTNKPWLMTLRLETSDTNVEISLRTDDLPGSSFRKIRCFSFSKGQPNEKLASLVSGYEHLLDGKDCEEEGEEDTMVSHIFAG